MKVLKRSKQGPESSPPPTMVYGIVCLFILFAVVTGAGCRRSDRTAILTFDTQDQEFSEAEVSIDRVPIGRMEQTTIKTSGDLYINGQFVATLPKEAPQIGKEDVYSGVLDSVRIKSGRHVVTFTTRTGKSLTISADISPGYHLITYAPSEKTLKWDNQTVSAVPGSAVTVTTGKR